MTRDHCAGGRRTGRERSDRSGTPGPGTGILIGTGATDTGPAITGAGTTGTAITGTGITGTGITGTGITGTGGHSRRLVTRL